MERNERTRGEKEGKEMEGMTKEIALNEGEEKEHHRKMKDGVREDSTMS